MDIRGAGRRHRRDSAFPSRAECSRKPRSTSNRPACRGDGRAARGQSRRPARRCSCFTPRHRTRSRWLADSPCRCRGRGLANRRGAAPVRVGSASRWRADADTRFGCEESWISRRTKTKVANETIETSLAVGALVHIEWRPKVAQAEVERGLTARPPMPGSTCKTACGWSGNWPWSSPRAAEVVLSSAFPKGIWSSGDGRQLRGWQAKEDGQKIEITLLKPATDGESLRALISRSEARSARRKRPKSTRRWSRSKGRRCSKARWPFAAAWHSTCEPSRRSA